MDTQYILIALNMAVVPLAAWFVKSWIKGVEMSLLKLNDNKADKRMMEEHCRQSATLKLDLVAQIYDIGRVSTDASDEIKENFRSHGHEVICTLCKATAGGVILR